MSSLRIVLFPASVKRILCTDTSVKRQILSQEVAAEEQVEFLCILLNR